jgi:DNA-binding NtrC family response regulator
VLKPSPVLPQPISLSGTPGINGAADIVAIDDDPLTIRALQSHLKRGGYRVATANQAMQGLDLIRSETAVALVDLHLPDLSGMDCLRYIRQNYPETQTIILTASSDTKDAVAAMREGAFQFLTKPFNPSQLLITIEKAIETRRVKNENVNLKESFNHSLPVRLVDNAFDLNGELLQKIGRISGLDSTVFIGGESGTGKSTVARMIHQRGHRANGPFISVNCASLPRDLLESELFGHTRGAFTGAVRDRVGHAELADGGTLFLDEIGDLPLDLQPKLLTFLQDRTIQRLGSAESKRIDVRLIVATHRDLADMCRQNIFRQDLYFRLMVISIDLLPLRERKTEIASITSAILTNICQRQRLAVKRLNDSSLRLLLDYDWPGNIRELENVLERAVAFSESDNIGPTELLFSARNLDRRSSTSGPRDLDNRQSHEATATPSVTLAGLSLDEIERRAILETLAFCEGNKAKSARSLGISEKSIYNKMRRLKINF